MADQQDRLEIVVDTYPPSSRYLRRAKKTYPGVERIVQSAELDGDIIPQRDGFNILDAERFSSRKEEETYYKAWDLLYEIIDKALAAESIERNGGGMRRAKRYFQEVWGLQQDFLRKGFAHFLEHDEMFKCMPDIPLVHPRDVVRYAYAVLDKYILPTP